MQTRDPNSAQAPGQSPTSPSPPQNELWWKATNKAEQMNNTRSPIGSPRVSFQSSYNGRRHSSFLSAEMAEKLAQRRASLERLHVEKISPWMHLYDFTEATETN